MDELYTAFRWDDESRLSPPGDDPNNEALSFQTIGREKGHLSRTAAADSKAFVTYSEDGTRVTVLLVSQPRFITDAGHETLPRSDRARIETDLRQRIGHILQRQIMREFS